jgi:hypothetical protein
LEVSRGRSTSSPPPSGGPIVNTPGSAVDVFVAIENLTGSPGDDLLSGDGNANVLNGGDGDDTLRGLSGSAFDDTITGDGQANVLDGRDGRDTIAAGSGDDTVVGGLGSDSLGGGGGDDLFLAHDGVVDTLDGGSGRDTAPLTSTEATTSRTSRWSGRDRVGMRVYRNSGRRVSAFWRLRIRNLTDCGEPGGCRWIWT